MFFVFFPRAHSLINSITNYILDSCFFPQMIHLLFPNTCKVKQQYVTHFDWENDLFSNTV